MVHSVVFAYEITDTNFRSWSASRRECESRYHIFTVIAPHLYDYLFSNQLIAFVHQMTVTKLECWFPWQVCVPQTTSYQPTKSLGEQCCATDAEVRTNLKGLLKLTLHDPICIA